MKPPRFLYAAPRSLDDALELLERADGGARLLAGGQSLLPLLNRRLSRPAALIDLNRIDELSQLRTDIDGLHFGAMVRHGEVESSPLVAATHSLLGRAAGEIGHIAIRNRGTIGGSLALGDPAAEWPLVALTLGASLTLRSRKRVRIVPAKDFYSGSYKTVLKQDEILTEVVFPTLPPRTTWGFQELCRRPHDFAIAAVAAIITLDWRGRIINSAIGLGSVDQTVILANNAAAMLVGSEGNSDAIAAAAEEASRECEPISDVRASANYRRQMVKALTARVLREAVQKAESQP